VPTAADTNASRTAVRRMRSACRSRRCTRRPRTGRARCGRMSTV
jgi:hypothetical protein